MVASLLKGRSTLCCLGSIFIGMLALTSIPVFAQADSPAAKQTNPSASELSDTVFLNNGQVLKGKVISQDETQLVILFDYGTLVVPASKIKSVQRQAVIAKAKDSPPQPTNHSLPAWRDIIQKLPKTSWAQRYQQIPATVIEVGTLKDVPYISFRVNGDYELNIYGDPDGPAAVEMGVYRQLVNDDGAKNNCMNFIAGLFQDSELRQVFDQLSRDMADKKVNGTLTFETTPSTAEDSYGGWWITVYNETELTQSRATKKELEAISIAKTGQTENTLIDPIAWTASDIKLARPVATYQPPASTYSSNVVAPATEYVPPSNSTGTGRVYVKGYYRKDGTYVEPHTRSRPRK